MAMDIKEMFWEKKISIEKVREKQPLIHCITNYVTANDVANIILAAGASPVMAESVDDVVDIEKISNGLMINLGTLRRDVIPAMVQAGRIAETRGIPVLLDPVGAGAISSRKNTALDLLKQFPCVAIRGNASEIGSLAAAFRCVETTDVLTGKGVDVALENHSYGDNLKKTIQMLQALSEKTNAVVVMTGEKDIVVENSRVCVIGNGHPWMSRITGSGCMMDGVLSAFLAVTSKQDAMLACVYGTIVMGVCGQIAYERTMKSQGETGSYRMYLMDAMSCILDEDIRGMADYEF